jgi:hypothetical protein
VTEEWSVLDKEEPVTGHEAAELISTNVRDGRLTTHFANDHGRTLMVVSNATRAMVVLMGGVGDPGEHAVSPGAAGSSEGYVLDVLDVSIAKPAQRQDRTFQPAARELRWCA